MSSANMNAEGEAVTCARQIELNPQGGARTNLHLPQEESGSDGYPRPCKINSPAGESNGQGKGEDSESNGDGGKDTISSKEIPDKSSEKTQTMDSHCSSESCIPTPSCRICFQGAEQGDLLSPCRCDGSVRHAHQQCLLKWISERGSWTCELCNYRFHIVAMTIKKPCQWQAVTMTLVEKVQAIAVFLGAVFLLASVSWLLWSALSPEALWQRRDILFQICYGMYGLMDLVCIGLIVHEGGAVYRVWMRWRAVNLLWDVQNYDKGQDLEEATGSRVTPTPPRTLWLPLTTLGSSVTHTHTTRLEPSPRCPLHLLSLCLRTTPDPPGQEEGSGEVVLRVTSV